MILNLPSLEIGKSILFVGLGGGYDICGCVPIYYSLKWQNESCKFVFANYNRSVSKMLKSEPFSTEGRLSEFTGVDCYALPRQGVRQIYKDLCQIVAEYDVDTVIAIDGGVDALMHGDEEGAGTVIEDSVTMSAISQLAVKNKLLAFVGFGTELEEDVCHFSLLENINELAQAGAFLGSCSLTQHMLVFGMYKDACEYAWDTKSPSHIQSKVIESVVGKHLYEGVEANVIGAKPADKHRSVLMSMYWFFDFNAVAQRNKLIPLFANTNTHTDVVMLYRQNIDELNKTRRKRKALPY